MERKRHKLYGRIYCEPQRGETIPVEVALAIIMIGQKMIFGSKDKRHRPPLYSLTEESIRNRLYGSAVGIAVDTQKGFSKKDKAREEKTGLIKEELKDERIKIQKELELLKRDLEQTRRKLDRMRGLGLKKIRLWFLYLAIFLIVATLTTISIKQLIFVPKTTARATIAEPGMIYSVQVAAYGNADDAQRFSSDLNSKGYTTFIKESRFTSGKVKFTVYAGGFKDEKTASRILDRLKTKEGIKDGFIISMPE